MSYFNKKCRNPRVEIDPETLGSDKADHGKVLWKDGEMFLYDLPSKSVLDIQAFRELQKARAREKERKYVYNREEARRKRRASRGLGWAVC